MGSVYRVIYQLLLRKPEKGMIAIYRGRDDFTLLLSPYFIF